MWASICFFLTSKSRPLIIVGTVIPGSYTCSLNLRRERRIAYDTRSIGKISLELYFATNSYTFDVPAIYQQSYKRIPPKPSFPTSVSKVNSISDLRTHKPSCILTSARIAFTIALYLAVHISYAPSRNNANIHAAFHSKLDT